MNCHHLMCEFPPNYCHLVWTKFRLYLILRITSSASCDSKVIGVTIIYNKWWVEDIKTSKIYRCDLPFNTTNSHFSHTIQFMSLCEFIAHINVISISLGAIILYGPYIYYVCLSKFSQVLILWSAHNRSKPVPLASYFLHNL